MWTSKSFNSTSPVPLFGIQHWLTREFQTEVQNLILNQTENRLGTLEVLFILYGFRYITGLAQLSEHTVLVQSAQNEDQKNKQNSGLCFIII